MIDLPPSLLHPSLSSRSAMQARNSTSNASATTTKFLRSFIWKFKWTLLLIALFAYAPLLTTARPLDDLRDTTVASSPVSVHPPIRTLVRRSYVVTNVSGVVHVVDPDSNTIIAQSKGSDGAGKAFDAAAIIWIGFVLAVGVSMAFVGVWGLRAFKVNVGWGRKVTVRLTTGVGAGLAGALAGWAALINSLSPSPISDVAIAIIVICFFAVPFVLGCSSIGRIPGITCIGIMGGFALGIRIVLLRANLLVQGTHGFGTNWAIVSLFGLAGLVSMLFVRTQRWGLLFGCASTGSFLLALGVDLILRKQDGMSRGLRYLFDRNGSHYLDIVVGGYNPSSLTQIIIGVSIASIAVFAVGQHYFFKKDFFTGLDPYTNLAADEESSKKRRLFPRTKPMFLKLDDDWDQRPSSGIPVGSVVRNAPVHPNTEKPPRSKLSYF